MSIGKKLQEQLNSLKGTAGDTDPNKLFSTEAVQGNVIASIDVYDFDRFAYSIKMIEVSKVTDEKKAIDVLDSLKNQAEDIVGKVSYLLEDLAVIEIDDVNNKALLRSAVPEIHGKEIRYYEVVINLGKRICMERFSYNSNEKNRKAIPFILTSEVLERVVNHLVKSISDVK